MFAGILRSFRKALRVILKKPATWLAAKIASAPDKTAVMNALTALYKESADRKSRKVKRLHIPRSGNLIIFSDQHRGGRDGSDDFAVCEFSYLSALEYYDRLGYHFINLGDCEELWENTMFGIARHNVAVFEKEKKFIARDAYYKVFGNHDLFWDNDPLSKVWLKKIYGRAIRIYTAVLIRAYAGRGREINIFCTHGHQGDRQSDGNVFSKWFVSYVWGPLQKLLEININSPSANDSLKTLHNMYMYDWSASQENVLLVTGHTHQPVFNSLTHLERLYQKLQKAKTLNDEDARKKIEEEIPRRKREYGYIHPEFSELRPTYFNSGCCCFDDGTITGIEISEGMIRLVKWKRSGEDAVRTVVEEEKLESLIR